MRPGMASGSPATSAAWQGVGQVETHRAIGEIMPGASAFFAETHVMLANTSSLKLEADLELGLAREIFASRTIAVIGLDRSEIKLSQMKAECPARATTRYVQSDGCNLNSRDPAVSAVQH